MAHRSMNSAATARHETGADPVRHAGPGVNGGPHRGTLRSAGQEDACLTALDDAEKAFGGIGDQAPGYIYLYDEGLHISNCGECHLALRNSDLAAEYAQQALVTLGQRSTRIIALTTVDLGRAHVQSNEIHEGARLLGEAGDIAAQNSSLRLVEVLKQGRADLRPWQHTTAVRALDDRLTSHGLVLT
ncbi:MAG: hypothetical protein ACRDSP_19875 [Pseudonocardiaceae bacterium]